MLDERSGSQLDLRHEVIIIIIHSRNSDNS